MIHRDFKGITNANGDKFTHPLFEEGLFVNGTLTEPDASGVIHLPSNATYTLQGRLYGKVVIGVAAEEPPNDTFVILDGVEIFSNDADAYSIYYASAKQSMYVTLAKNKKNTLVCLHEQDMQSDQGACLFSENNMIVQGNGYLTCINHGGHGVRASELRFSGNPHVYAEAIHDAIHGNSALTIDGGFFYVNKANDAFGTGTTGSIKIFGGKFRAYNVRQNVFDSKQPGYYFCDLDLHTAVFSSINGLTRCNPATYFGEAVVTNAGVPVIPVSGVYTCTGGVDARGESVSVIVQGYIQGRIEVINPKTDVRLHGAYIASSSGPAISCSQTSSKIVIKADSGTDNYVLQTATSGTAYNAIDLSNNIEVEAKGGSRLVIHSVLGSGISASNVTFQDMKGSVIINDCGKYGVIGTAFYISLIDKGIVKDVYGAIMSHGNALADFYARTSSKGAKATITVYGDGFRGCLSAGKLETSFISSDGAYLSLSHSPHVFYSSAKTNEMRDDCGKTYEPYDVIPYGVGTFALNAE